MLGLQWKISRKGTGEVHRLKGILKSQSLRKDRTKIILGISVVETSVPFNRKLPFYLIKE